VRLISDHDSEVIWPSLGKPGIAHECLNVRHDSGGVEGSVRVSLLHIGLDSKRLKTPPRLLHQFLAVKTRLS